MKILTKLKACEGPVRASNSIRLVTSVLDGETISIGTEVYEFDTAAAPGMVVPGNIRVDCSSGSSPSLSNPALVAAINANSRQVTAVSMGSNEVLVMSRLDVAPRPYACGSTMAGVGNGWTSPGVFNGGNDGFSAFQMLSRAVTTQEVALGTLRFLFPFKCNAYAAFVRSGNVAKAWGGTLTRFSVGGMYCGIALTNNATVDFASGDFVTVFASE